MSAVLFMDLDLTREGFWRGDSGRVGQFLRNYGSRLLFIGCLDRFGDQQNIGSNSHLCLERFKRHERPPRFPSAAASAKQNNPHWKVPKVLRYITNTNVDNPALIGIWGIGRVNEHILSIRITNGFFPAVSKTPMHSGSIAFSQMMLSAQSSGKVDKLTGVHVNGDDPKRWLH